MQTALLTAHKTQKVTIDRFLHCILCLSSGVLWWPLFLAAPLLRHMIIWMMGGRKALAHAYLEKDYIIDLSSSQTSSSISGNWATKIFWILAQMIFNQWTELALIKLIYFINVKNWIISIIFLENVNLFIYFGLFTAQSSTKCRLWVVYII